MKTGQKKLLVLLVDDDPEVLLALGEDLVALFGEALSLESCESAAEALSFVKETFNLAEGTGLSVAESSVLMPFVISDFNMPAQDGLGLLRELRSLPGVAGQAKHILLSGQADYECLRIGINEGLFERALGKPWCRDELYTVCKDLLSEFLLGQALDQIEHYTHLVSHNQYSRALLQAKHAQEGLKENLRSLQRGLLAKRSESLVELMAGLKAEFLRVDSRTEAALLRNLEAGEILFSENDVLEAMWLILEGEVAHRKKQSEDEELFVEGPGHILGSMSYFLGQGAFTQVVARKSTTVARLDPKSLDEVLESRPDFALVLINVLLRQGMHRVKQHVEQGHKLKVALAELHAAENHLIESERLATLGQLVAGVAHELNNPAAAILRGAEHVAESVKRVLFAERADGDVWQDRASQVFTEGFAGGAISTQVIRERAKALGESLGVERDDAKMLAEMGLSSDTPWLGEVVHSSEDSSAAIARLHDHYLAGKFLRNLQASGQRVAALVQSLKHYARPSSEHEEDVDVTEGVEDSGVILHNRLKSVHFEKTYKPVPLVRASPGELGQIWTNLLSNALDAVQDKPDPSIAIEVGVRGNDVLVAVSDNGCGMDASQMSRIFEINYTTKKQGHFGLGLGLAICERIVGKFGGRITVASKKGEGSRFEVLLPAIESSTATESAREKGVVAQTTDTGPKS